VSVYHHLLTFSDPVRTALEQGTPVLALESTVITHGLAWPANLETSMAIEAVVREQGVVPATIAVLDGKLRLGLDAEDIERLAKLGPEARKCSRRDLPFALHSEGAGATTVAATMMIAAMAGIRIFATGGIGGVHRGAESSLDISADLQELARTPVAVVCAGPKAILDLGLTGEYLETHGVPVMGYRTDQLPAFYTRESGVMVDQRLESATDIAEVLGVHWSLGMAGALIGNPIPAEFALDKGLVDAGIATAIEEAEVAGVSGKELTPWLLSRLEALTGGKSVAANKALIINNARLGAQIAAELSR
jgi:pseudouridine-5'-phosphate glycosidase